MSGITLEINADELSRLLNRAAQTLAQPDKLFEHIGEALIDIHRTRFERQTTPDGTPWQPLADWYQAVKPKNKNKILTLDGHLGRILSYNASREGLEFGSHFPYAAIHQFGGTIRPKHAKALNVGGRAVKRVIIPARPWLGLSDNDQQRILEIAKSHLKNAFNA